MLEPHSSITTSLRASNCLHCSRQAARASSLRSVAPSVFFFREGKGYVGSSKVKYEQERKESVKHKEQAHETTQNVCKCDATLVSTDRT